MSYPQLLHASNVSFRYKRLRQADGRRECAVNDASLTVRPGAVTALVGSNGSGKSTLLKILLGYAHPSRGSVQVWIDRQGRSAREPKALIPGLHLGRLLKVGLVAQTNSLDGKLNLSQNLDLAGRLVGLSRQERLARALKLMAAFGLEGLAKVPICEGSGGQRRRADLARALMCNPEFLVLDEGGSGLDSESLGDLGALIRSNLMDPKENLDGVLLVTHRSSELEWADSFVVMEDGRTFPQIDRREVDAAEPAERLVLGLQGAVGDGSESCEPHRFGQELAALVGPGLVGVELLGNEPSASGCELLCSVRQGREFLPQLFSSHLARSVVSVEWRPEDLLARVRRCALQRVGHFAHDGRGLER